MTGELMKSERRFLRGQRGGGRRSLGNVAGSVGRIVAARGVGLFGSLGQCGPNRFRKTGGDPVACAALGEVRKTESGMSYGCKDLRDISGVCIGRGKKVVCKIPADQQAAFACSHWILLPASASASRGVGNANTASEDEGT